MGICPHRTSVHHKSPPCLAHLVGNELTEPIASLARSSSPGASDAEYKDSAQSRRAWHQCGLESGLARLSANKQKRRGQRPGDSRFDLLSKMNAQPILQCVDDRLTITFIGGSFPNILKAMSISRNIKPWLSSSGTLLAEIAVRTILALQESAGWEICSNPDCRRLYRPRRHVAEGRLHFCNIYGKRASWRLSKRRKSAGVHSR